MKQSFQKVLRKNLKMNLIRKSSVLLVFKILLRFDFIEAPRKKKTKHLKKKLKILVTSEQYQIL